jgi:hypothetical protein
MTSIAEQLESAVLGASPLVLDDIMRACWRGLAAGELSELDAEGVSEAAEARRAALKAPRPKPTPTPPAAARRPVVSPDRRASRERKRRVAASGSLPPNLAAGFTQGELAVLSIVAAEVRRGGRCAMFIDQIAALAGVSRSTAKNAIRQGSANSDEGRPWHDQLIGGLKLAKEPNATEPLPTAAQSSGRAKTGQRVAIPRNTCSPRGISAVVVSAATAPETRTL